MTSNEQTLGDRTPPQLRPYSPLRQRHWQIFNICILRSKNTSAVSWCFLSVQQQMSQHDGTAPGSAAIKEPFLPVWNAATYHGNYRSETCGTNTINLMDRNGKNFVKRIATFRDWLIQQWAGWAQGVFLPLTWAPNSSGFWQKVHSQDIRDFLPSNIKQNTNKLIFGESFNIFWTLLWI